MQRRKELVRGSSCPQVPPARVAEAADWVVIVQTLYPNDIAPVSIKLCAGRSTCGSNSQKTCFRERKLCASLTRKHCDVDINGNLVFLSIYAAPVMRLLDDPKTSPDEPSRFKWKASSKKRAHGVLRRFRMGNSQYERPWYALYSILEHAWLMCFNDDETWDSISFILLQGVYMHVTRTAQKTEGCARYAPMCHDGVFWRASPTIVVVVVLHGDKKCERMPDVPELQCTADRMADKKADFQSHCHGSRHLHVSKALARLCVFNGATRMEPA